MFYLFQLFISAGKVFIAVPIDCLGTNDTLISFEKSAKFI